MDNLVVIVIVVLAVAYIVRTFRKRSNRRLGCDCGCSSCDIGPTCDPTKGRANTPEQ